MVKVLDREKIKRMTGAGSGVVGSSGGGDVDLSGYATQIWTTENFVSIEFFRKLFRAFDSSSNEILPNDTTSVVNNIKAMVGTWTEQYLTALGNAGGGGGGGGGAQYLNDLLDVQLTTPITDGQALVYNATLAKWVNGAAGVNMTTVWNALSGSTNEQINISHLTTALSGYATTSAISDMATQTWVGQQGFATQTWVGQNFITIAYFDRLFRAYNDSTLVSHNDTTSTINNIKAMFGFWTEFYLSALGTGGVSSVSISLSQLADVNVSGVTNGQVLSYNSTSGTWVPATISGGGTDMSTVWTNLAAATNEQINISHLTTALSGYATTSALGNYLPLTGGALSGMLTMNATLYMNTNAIFYRKVYQTNASVSFEMGGSASFAPSIGDGPLVCVKDSTAVGEGRKEFGIDWYGNYYGNYAVCYGFMKNGSSDQYVLLGGGGHKLLSEIGGSGTYLPLAGGTMTGVLASNTYMDIKNFIYFRNYNNDNWAGYVGRGGGSVNDIMLIGLNNYVSLNGLGIKIECGIINSTGTITYIGFDGSSYVGYGGGNTGNTNIYGGQILFCNHDGGSVRAIITSSGAMGVGTTSPAAMLHVNGSFRANTISSVGATDLNGDCTIGTSSSWSSTTMLVWPYAIFQHGLSNGSDMRKKDVISDCDLAIFDIANAPAFLFRWKDPEDTGIYAGTSAQYWQAKLPEVVHAANDAMHTLSMQYDVLAVVASIAIAKKVVSHEEQIRLLETRVSELEKENDELRKLIA